MKTKKKRQSRAQRLTILKNVNALIDATHFDTGAVLEFNSAGKPKMCILGLIQWAQNPLEDKIGRAPKRPDGWDDGVSPEWNKYRAKMKAREVKIDEARQRIKRETQAVIDNRGLSEELAKSILELHPGRARLSSYSAVTKWPDAALANFIFGFNDEVGKKGVKRVVEHAAARLEAQLAAKETA